MRSHEAIQHISGRQSLHGVFPQILVGFISTYMKENEQIKEYRAKLPDRINVSIKNEDGSFWAKITTPDGELSNCYTQANNISELVVMINDAVQTHFEIPEKIREKVGFYVPISDNHLRWEAMFNQLSAMQNKGGKKTILTLRKPELVG